MNRKGNILTENVIFVVLNLAFLSILLLFVYIQSSPTHLMEESTAKQIALLIDASKPGTEITLDIGDAIEKASKNNIQSSDAVKIDNDNNLVIVKLSEKSYYDYSFFNDVTVFGGADKTGYLKLEIK